MSKTPITDKNTVGYPQGEFVPARISKELETQLTAAKEKIATLEVQIKNQAAQITGRHQYIGQDFQFRMNRLTERAEDAEATIKALREDADRYQCQWEFLIEEVDCLRDRIVEVENLFRKATGYAVEEYQEMLKEVRT